MKTYWEIKETIDAAKAVMEAEDIHPEVKKEIDKGDHHSMRKIHSSSGHTVHAFDHDEGIHYKHHDHKTNKVHTHDYDPEDHGDMSSKEDHADFHNDTKSSMKNSPSSVHKAIVNDAKKHAIQ